MGRIFLAFLAAVITAMALASIVQTQFALGYLQALGVPMPLDVRLSATWFDLVHFAPTLGGVILAGFLIAFLVAALIIRVLPHLRFLGYALAGGTALLVALLAMQSAFGFMPIAGARGAFGFLSLVLCGVIGGCVFALSSRKGSAQDRGTP